MVSYSQAGLLPYLYDPISDWFDGWYKSDWNQQKFMQYLFLKQIPGISWNIALYEGNSDNEEYMKRNNLTWDDINHADRLPGVNAVSSGIRGGVNFVSSNITRLYHDSRRSR